MANSFTQYPLNLKVCDKDIGSFPCNPTSDVHSLYDSYSIKYTGTPFLADENQKIESLPSVLTLSKSYKKTYKGGYDIGNVKILKKTKTYERTFEIPHRKSTKFPSYKHYIPLSKQWSSSVYSYNLFNLISSPYIHDVVYKLCKSYVNASPKQGLLDNVFVLKNVHVKRKKYSQIIFPVINYKRVCMRSLNVNGSNFNVDNYITEDNLLSEPRMEKNLFFFRRRFGLNLYLEYKVSRYIYRGKKLVFKKRVDRDITYYIETYYNNKKLYSLIKTFINKPEMKYTSTRVETEIYLYNRKNKHILRKVKKYFDLFVKKKRNVKKRLSNYLNLYKRKEKKESTCNLSLKQTRERKVKKKVCGQIVKKSCKRHPLTWYYNPKYHFMLKKSFYKKKNKFLKLKKKEKKILYKYWIKKRKPVQDGYVEFKCISLREPIKLYYRSLGKNYAKRKFYKNKRLKKLKRIKVKKKIKIVRMKKNRFISRKLFMKSSITIFLYLWRRSTFTSRKLTFFLENLYWMNKLLKVKHSEISLSYSPLSSLSNQYKLSSKLHYKAFSKNFVKRVFIQNVYYLTTLILFIVNACKKSVYDKFIKTIYSLYDNVCKNSLWIKSTSLVLLSKWHKHFRNRSKQSILKGFKPLFTLFHYKHNLILHYFEFFKRNNQNYLSLKNIVKKIVHKKPAFVGINLKYWRLDSQIISDIMVNKLIDRTKKLWKVLKKSFYIHADYIGLPKAKIDLKDLGTSFFWGKKNVFFSEKIGQDNLYRKSIVLSNSQVGYNHVIHHSMKYRNSIVLHNLQNKWKLGTSYRAKGRLTKRKTAERSLNKMKYIGSLENPLSSKGGVSTSLSRGSIKSNLQKVLNTSYNINGSFALKVSISGLQTKQTWHTTM